MTLASRLEDRPIETHTVEFDLWGTNRAASQLAAKLVETQRLSPGPRRGPCVSIEAPWGGGKTSFANLLCGHIRELCGVAPPLVIRLNVWQSSGLDLSPWAAIAYRLGEAFYKWLVSQIKDGKVHIQPPNLGAHEEPLPLEATKPLSHGGFADGRLHWLEAAKRISALIPDEHWDPCFKLFSDAPSKVPGRGKGWAEGLTVLTKLASAATKAYVTVDPVAAVEGAVDAAKELRPSQLIEGPSWGVDTREFVVQLNTLLRSLYPNPTMWRAILVVDDIARVRREEIPFVLDALGYVRDLDDVLVLLCIDESMVNYLEKQAQEQVVVHSQGGHEPYMTKLVTLRHRLGQTGIADMAQLASRFFTDLGLDPTWSFTDGLNPTRRLLDQGLCTPRQIKRALHWMYIRVAGEGPDGMLPLLRRDSALAERVFALLVDLHLFVEGRLTAADLIKSTHKSVSVLNQFPNRPWDGGDWHDRQGRERAGDTDSAEARLTSILRLIALSQFAGQNEPHLITEGNQAWLSWRREVRFKFRLNADWLHTPAELPYRLASKAEEYSIKDFSLWSALSRSARSHGLATGGESPSLQWSWCDVDELVQITKIGDPSSAASALIVIALVHPDFARRIGIRTLEKALWECEGTQKDSGAFGQGTRPLVVESLKMVSAWLDNKR
ncbi:MAG: hypothetical protein IPK82_13805 [Polyangiaceae bacterium]|nr:hypothetical protein [Polyangiaceae bacterium]